MLGMIKSRGVLTDNGVCLQPHEKLTVDFFLDRGDNVELIVPSYTAGRKNADVILYDKTWEMKAPTTANRNTLEVMYKHAVRQSPNLIIDLRRLEFSLQGRVKRMFEKRFRESVRIERMLIITNRNLTRFTKGSCKI